jgi:hypothetical protein
MKRSTRRLQNGAVVGRILLSIRRHEGVATNSGGVRFLSNVPNAVRMSSNGTQVKHALSSNRSCDVMYVQLSSAGTEARPCSRVR